MFENLSNEILFLIACVIDVLVIITFVFLIIFTTKQCKKINQIKQQLAEEKKWHKIAYIDALTGMRNRMAFNACASEIEKSAKENDEIRVIVMDINDFKQINDTFGHNVGDETLQMTAELLDEVFDNDSFFVFRMGGDEFAIISIDVPKEEIEKRISMIKTSDVGESIGCTFSFGWATVDLSADNPMEEALILADREMYAEKAKKKTTIA